jgi:hypothetical protein
MNGAARICCNSVVILRRGGGWWFSFLVKHYIKEGANPVFPFKFPLRQPALAFFKGVNPPL